MLLSSTVSATSISSSDIVSQTDSLIENISKSFEGLTTGNIIAICIVVFLVVMLLLELLRSKYVLTLTKRFVTLDKLPKEFDGTKLAVVSDLHQMRFGEGNSELAKRIKREDPDYIIFVGDMGDYEKYNVHAYYDLLENQEDKIPVIMVPGNHDLRLGNGTVHKNFVREVERSGAVILSNTSAEMVAGGKKLYIYGFCQPLNAEKDKPAREWSFAEVSDDDVAATLGKCPKDAPVILLAHDPQPFMCYEKWGADLVLSGHLHGGGIRLPYFGGVIGPNKSFFPKYSAGLIEGRKSRMFVTRGLASPKLPRFLNPPEIALLTLTCPGSPLLGCAEQPVIALPKYHIDEQMDEVNETPSGKKTKRPAAKQDKYRRAGKSAASKTTAAKENTFSAQFEVVRDWIKSEARSIRELLYERFNQLSDFIALMFGKKRSKYSIVADENKKRNTYIAPNNKKKKPQHRYASNKPGSGKNSSANNKSTKK